MNPQAAQELLDLIMLDDYVARKQAFDDWSRRWVATVMLEHPVPLHQIRALEGIHGKESVALMARSALLERMLTGIVLEQNVKGVRVEVKETASVRVTRLEMHVILQKPRDINAGTDATKKMLDMAKGGGK